MYPMDLERYFLNMNTDDKEEHFDMIVKRAEALEALATTREQMLEQQPE